MVTGHGTEWLAATISLAIIASCTILGWHGTLDGSAIVGLLGAIGGAGVGGFTASHSARSTLDSVSQPGGKRATDPPT